MYSAQFLENICFVIPQPAFYILYGSLCFTKYFYTFSLLGLHSTGEVDLAGVIIMCCEEAEN